MKPIWISLALTGCIAPPPMTYSGSYYPRASTDGEQVAPDDESLPAPIAPGGRLACARDRAGASFSAATALRKGTFGGCLDTTATDVYALTAGDNPGGTMFGVKMSSKENTCAELFDQYKKSITSSECTWVQHSEYLWAAVAPGTTVYLKLERQSDVISPYQLEVTEQVIADVEEPNNSWKASVPLALDTPHTALLADLVNDKSSGRDFYKITLAKAQKVAIVVDPNADDVRPEVTILDADRRKLEDWQADNQGAVLREQIELRAGTYYVEVSTSDWGIGYGNGPSGSDSHGAAHPTGHYTKPYQIEISTIGEVQRNNRRVSKR
jgi:hypothetical protein